MLDFRPPLDTPALISFVKFVLPLYMRVTLHETSVFCAEGAIERFNKLKGQRTLICPNHANRHDPQVMFTFSKYVEEDFNFVAAREVFDYDHGLNGWWLQHLGTYSVVRGAADRESFKTTRRILSEGKKKLVLFPEGEISRQNDTLMALESGAAQMAFWAMTDLEKTNPEASIYIMPMAFKYTYPEDISTSFRRCLHNLESELGVPSVETDSFYVRLRRLGDKLLISLEREYGLKTPENSTMNERVVTLRGFILSNIASYLKIDLPKGGRELESVRILRNAMDDFIFDDEKVSDYEKRVHEDKAKTIKGFYKDLNRVVNFIAIYEGYFRDRMTQERFADMLDRFETEVFGGEPTFKGPRRVLVDVGEAIDLKKHYDGYKANKKAESAKVTEQIFGQISAMLAKLEESRTPIFLN